MSISLRLVSIVFVFTTLACEAAENSDRPFVRRNHVAAASDLFESKPLGRRIPSEHRDAAGIARVIFSENHQPTYRHVL